MKYFVMLDGEQQGPYRLDELITVGVRPSTYVWCKEMAEWEKAEDVPDICRLFRRHLAGIHPVDTVQDESADGKDAEAGRSSEQPRHNPLPRFSRFIDNPKELYGKDLDQQDVDISTPPANLLPLALFAALFCFPVTGFVALYFSWRTQRLWKSTGDPGLDNAQVRELQRKAYDSARLARMWIGYSLSLSFILFAIIFFRSY